MRLCRQAANEVAEISVAARALAILLDTLEITGLRNKGIEELTLLR